MDAPGRLPRGVTIHPKLIATTLTGAVAIIVAAITRGSGDPATIVLAGLTVLQAIAGYLTPSPEASPMQTPLDPIAQGPPQEPGTPPELITTAGAAGPSPPA